MHQEASSSPMGPITWRGITLLCDVGHFYLTSLLVHLETPHIETLVTKTLNLSSSSGFLFTPFCNVLTFPQELPSFFCSHLALKNLFSLLSQETTLIV